eukprot:1159599-Pelagomonas_calceolata.AAC.1
MFGDEPLSDSTVYMELEQAVFDLSSRGMHQASAFDWIQRRLLMQNVFVIKNMHAYDQTTSTNTSHLS